VFSEEIAGEMVPNVDEPGWLTSGIGTKRSSRHLCSMSAHAVKADSIYSL